MSMKPHQILTCVISMSKQPEYIAKGNLRELENIPIEIKQNEIQREERLKIMNHISELCTTSSGLIHVKLEFVVN